MGYLRVVIYPQSEQLAHLVLDSLKPSGKELESRNLLVLTYDFPLQVALVKDNCGINDISEILKFLDQILDLNFYTVTYSKS